MDETTSEAQDRAELARQVGALVWAVTPSMNHCGACARIAAEFQIL